MHFTSANSRLISSLQVFLSFHVPIPVYHYQKVNAYYYIGYTFINRCQFHTYWRERKEEEEGREKEKDRDMERNSDQERERDRLE